MAAVQDPEFEALLTFLKESRGFDFTGYKRSSLIRRVERRMQQIDVGSYFDYLDFLQLHPDEFTALFNMILINVTGFFRDPEAWTYLQEEAIRPVLEAKGAGPIRVWSAGCASGEEAYSAAMMLAELLGPADFRDRVKIYATDVDDDALTIARHGSYPESAVKAVPDDLRERYFERQGTRFVFRNDLRRSVIFGRNDLVQDAPISRVDLLLCRNTLMYFNAETQSRIVNRFHFAMSNPGVLFLGRAEMLLSHTERFEPIDLKRRFFRKIPRGNASHDLRTLTVNGALLAPADPADLPWLRSEALSGNPVATLIVNREGTLVFCNQRAAVMFGLTSRDVGRPFRDLEVSYRPIELRAYIDEVHEERRATWIREVEVPRGPDDSVYLDIEVAPIVTRDDASAAVALYFTDVTRYRTLQNELEVTNRQLETAYEELQSTVEELETTNEELQPTVEELETTNEELQSTNEELETMNEELQSTNDELQAINEELRDRTRDVQSANSFLESILRSLDTAVVVVDRELIITAWNRRAEDMWGVRADEAIGQHFYNLDIGMPLEPIKSLIRTTLLNTGDAAEPVTLSAVNRRGRNIEVRVSSAALGGTDSEVTGTIVLIDAL